MSFRGITRYGGVRSPYLSRPSAKKEYMIDYARLDGGLNLWDLDYRMGRNESPEMENLWWRDGVLCCRDGQNACDGVDEDGKKAGPGVGYAASNGQFHGMEFFHIGACIYYGDPSQEDMTLVKLCEGIPEVRGTFFQYDGALYYKTKGCFKKITKGETFAAADVAGYVPVIVLNADPATGSGDLYRPENRLRPTGKTVWCNAKDGRDGIPSAGAGCGGGDEGRSGRCGKDRGDGLYGRSGKRHGDIHVGPAGDEPADEQHGKNHLHEGEHGGEEGRDGLPVRGGVWRRELGGAGAGRIGGTAERLFLEREPHGDGCARISRSRSTTSRATGPRP